MTPSNDFDKNDAIDKRLSEWSVVYPDIPRKTFDENIKFNEYIEYLSNLKEVLIDKESENKTQIEYIFEEEIIANASCKFKDSKLTIEQATEKVKECRERDEKERNYINNIIREWDRYDVPNAENGYYFLNNAGVFKKVITPNEETGQPNFADKDICRTVFVICGVSEPLNDDTIYYKVRFRTRNQEIKEFWGSQSELLSKNELKKLFLSKGINLPENELLKETIEYISRSIADFGSRLKKEYSTKQCGYNEDKSLFVLGDRAVSLNGIEPILSTGIGKGFKELEKTGTLEKWMEEVKEIYDYPVVRFKSYDALTAPLKSILGVESHVTDHYGNTSVGKTFSAHVALSLVGDPEGLTIGAKSSPKGILVTIRDFSDLPLLIDESSDAGEHLADLVYPLTSNKGRVKSTQDGKRDGGEEYHTSIMFTGEKPIRDCLKNSGQQYRVNELDDTLPDLSTKQINKVKDGIKENHGHIIELYLKKMFEWKESGLLKKYYNRCFDSLPQNKSNIEGRSRSIFACIMTSGLILEAVFRDVDFPFKQADVIVKEYYKKCIQEKPVELEYLRALRIVLDWVNSEFGMFAEGKESNDFVTYKDKNKVYGFVDNIFIDIIGSVFTKKMKDEGFSSSKIKEDWFKQGISESNDKERVGTYRFKRDGKSIPGVRINRNIAEELLGLKHETIKRLPEDQDEKVKRVLKIIKFLTEIDSAARISKIRTIAEIPDVDEILKKLVTNSKKLMKINQDEYIYLN